MDWLVLTASEIYLRGGPLALFLLVVYLFCSFLRHKRRRRKLYLECKLEIQAGGETELKVTMVNRDRRPVLILLLGSSFPHGREDALEVKALLNPGQGWEQGVKVDGSSPLLFSEEEEAQLLWVEDHLGYRYPVEGSKKELKRLFEFKRFRYQYWEDSL